MLLICPLVTLEKLQLTLAPNDDVTMTSCWLLDEIYNQWIWDHPLNVHVPFAILVGVCDNICD